MDKSAKSKYLSVEILRYETASASLRRKYNNKGEKEYDKKKQKETFVIRS